MEPLNPPPLEPLPSLWTEKRKKRLLGWATVVAVLCAIGIGMLHGLGNKIFDGVDVRGSWARLAEVERLRMEVT